jgi:hypothetical protein
MRKIEINITEEQYKILQQKIEKETLINLKEETHSGFQIKLNVIEGGLSWIEFEMNSTIEIGEVDWKLE